MDEVKVKIINFKRRNFDPYMEIINATNDKQIILERDVKLMSFKVTISDMPNVWEKCIESVICKIDAPNDVNARGTDVDNIIEIIGSIGASEPTVALYKWSLLPTNDSKVYRNVEIEIVGAQGEVLRKVNFPNAFVVDYSESYSKYKGDGTFYLLLKQKKDKNDKIQVEGDILDFED